MRATAFTGGGGILKTTRDIVDIDFQVLPIGCGGYITNIQAANDGTFIIRTDTYGGYIWSGTGPWRQFLTMYTMPAADPLVGYLNGNGVNAVGIAPSNSQVVWMVFAGANITNARLYCSFNQGFNWILTPTYGVVFGPVAWGPNDSTAAISTRLKSHYIAADPQNPSVVYVSSPVNGLWQSFDFGFTGTLVSAVGVGQVGTGLTQGGGHLIAFDTTSAVVGGRTQGIYVATYGVGVFHSTNGGTTWTQISNSTTGPTNLTHNHLIVDQTGKVWLVTDNQPFSNTYATLWTYTPAGGWAQNPTGPAPPTTGGLAYRVRSVAVHPTNANTVVVNTDSGNAIMSLDGGFTFNDTFFFNDQQVAGPGDPPWVPYCDGTAGPFMGNANTLYGPIDKWLYLAAGRGVWKCQFPTAGLGSTPIPYPTPEFSLWVTQNIGIEQLVTNQIFQPPGGAPCAVVGDKAFFRLPNTATYPTRFGPFDPLATPQALNLFGSAGDWASSNPSTLVLLANVLVEQSSYSNDGGQTWTLFPNSNIVPSATGAGGSISASTTTNFIWIPSANNSYIYSTNNSGTTWTQVLLPGATATTGGWGFAFFLNNQMCCADRVNANTFYAYNVSAAPIAGIWKSTDGGLTWIQVFSGFLNGTNAIDGFNGKLRSVQGQAGHMFWTPGPEGSATTPHPSTQAAFWRSTNGGVTWTQVPNVYEVGDVAFGAAAPGASYPAIYLSGWINNMYGIWQSDDNTATWQYLTQWPNGSFDFIKCVGANPDVYGTVYVGTSGSGYHWRHR